jgi:hypothetical protein
MKYNEELFDGYDEEDYVYIYSNHLSGGYYTTKEYQEDTYCETCGDSDWLEDSGLVKDLKLIKCEDEY